MVRGWVVGFGTVSVWVGEFVGSSVWVGRWVRCLHGWVRWRWFVGVAVGVFVVVARVGFVVVGVGVAWWVRWVWAWLIFFSPIVGCGGCDCGCVGRLGYLVNFFLFSFLLWRWL